MLSYGDVVDAWDRADPRHIHPSRDESEQSYWDSGRCQAQQLDRAFRGVGVDGTVLDYGCGDGRVAIPMADLGWHVVAADTSPRMLARLRSHAGDTVEVADAAALPQVDAAYCLAVLIHHSYVDARRIVQRVADAVRPGGLLVLDWPVSDQPRERGGWIEVTTWAASQRSEAAAGCGLEPADIGLPWSTWRRT